MGTVPAAYIVTRLAAGKDIRALGSGQSGRDERVPCARREIRRAGFSVRFPEGLRARLRGFALRNGVYRLAARDRAPRGGAAIAGHLFSPWTGWRGGKGVATGAGVVTALCPPLAPGCLAVFALVLLVSRRMSVASIAAACSVPLWYLAISFARGNGVDWFLLSFFALVPAVVVARHREISGGSRGNGRAALLIAMREANTGDVTRINGITLYYCFVSGYENVLEHKKRINDINVFPVADGDTGNNMASTFYSITQIPRRPDRPRARLPVIADRALSGARGNSGIIIAQFLNALASECADRDTLTAPEIGAALRVASASAYKQSRTRAMGTLITVLRAWAEEMGPARAQSRMTSASSRSVP